MRATDIFLFLVGNRGAIQRIAGSWWSLLVSALLVVTAGIARNYDHLDLLRNAEWIYGPFVASLVSSLLVYAVASRYLRPRSIHSEGLGYLSFMCIYWMTAPCAWLYAIPVESMLAIRYGLREEDVALVKRLPGIRERIERAGGDQTHDRVLEQLKETDTDVGEDL